MSQETITQSGAVRTSAPAVHALDRPTASASVAGAGTRAPGLAPTTLDRSAPVRQVSAPVRNEPVRNAPVQSQAVRTDATRIVSAVQGSTGVRRLMAGVVLVVALAISAGAAFESFYAFERTAIFFGWPTYHAWIIMPLVELFLILGSFELALRVLEGGKTAGPRAMAYSALVITIAVNVGYHVLTLLLPIDDKGRLIRTNELIDVHWWQPVALGIFAAIVPVAQLLALHVFSGRLRRIAEARKTVVRTETPGLKISSLLHQAVANRVAARVDAPVRTEQTATTRTGAPDGAHRPAPASASVSAPGTTGNQTNVSANPVRTGADAPGRTSAPDSNVVEIGPAARASMEDALRRIHERFSAGHASWESLAAKVSLSQIEIQLRIGKRRSKPALAAAESILPWASIPAAAQAADHQ